MYKIVIFAFTVLFSCKLFAVEQGYSLDISFAKFRQVEGQSHFQVLDCSNTALAWDDLPEVRAQNFTVTSYEHKVTLNELPEGHYCLRFFQDLNANGILDVSSSSIPKEPVGFSNNPNLMMGLPSPENSMFDFASSKAIKVNVNYKKRR